LRLLVFVNNNNNNNNNNNKESLSFCFSVCQSRFKALTRFFCTTVFVIRPPGLASVSDFNFFHYFFLLREYIHITIIVTTTTTTTTTTTNSSSSSSSSSSRISYSCFTTISDNAASCTAK